MFVLQWFTGHPAYPAQSSYIPHWLHFISLNKSNPSVICSINDAYLVPIQINTLSNRYIHSFGTWSLTFGIYYLHIF